MKATAVGQATLLPLPTRRVDRPRRTRHQLGPRQLADLIASGYAAVAAGSSSSRFEIRLGDQQTAAVLAAAQAIDRPPSDLLTALVQAGLERLAEPVIRCEEHQAIGGGATAQKDGQLPRMQ